ncbi:hypothetical protein ACFE04_025371 [Oxalis oulophora]
MINAAGDIASQLNMPKAKSAEKSESLFEVTLTEKFSMTPKYGRKVGPSVVPPQRTLDLVEASEKLVDVNIMPEMEFALSKYEHPLLNKTPTFVKHQLNPNPIPNSGRKSASRIVLSSLKMAVFDQISQANQLSTPMKSSTCKKHVVSDLDINKENIDNSGMTAAEPKKDVKTNSKSSGENKLGTNMSLRQLQKILKEKLRITNKAQNTKDNNNDSVGNARVALQTISENRMPNIVAEAEE